MSVLSMKKDIYNDRKYADGYPNMAQLAQKFKANEVGSRPDDTPRVLQLLTYLCRLIDLSESRKILVLGCGPQSYKDPLRLYLSPTTHRI